MSRKKIIAFIIIGLVLILITVSYFYTHKQLTPVQKNMFRAVIKIPNNEGLEAKLSSIKNDNLEGLIKDTKTGKKTGGRLVVYTNKAKIISDDAAAFILPFEIDYLNNTKYLYLGAFYLDPENPSAIGKDMTFKTPLKMVLKHSYSYLIGENATSAIINSFIPGSYSYAVNLSYYDNAGQQKDLALRLYYGTEKIEIAKKCEEVGSITEREKSDENKYYVCVFDDSHECTLDAYEQGNCPVGGYDISITDKPIEKWGIAQGFLFKKGKFIFTANNENCTIEDFYWGRCKVN